MTGPPYQPAGDSVVDDPLRYVALGDSYTIGTAIDPSGRWPDGLVAALAGDRPRLELVANLGVNGYTSRQLIQDELPALDALAPDFVTVLIGVNDVVQGVPPETYEANVVEMLDRLLARLSASRIVTVSIPDYTVTPAGGDYGDPQQQRAGIVDHNSTMARLSTEREIAFVDIVDISLEASTDRSLVADDGLHPSAAQYARWTERILPVVRERLRAP
ncbi:MAG TPA: SGNH/GDSL hydrolase family protein [Candidatus Saccharimonadales bacterium]|nr:SGNH/GDSL hydrolase family protein [Candidatus Saccharimonadales bacterium]